MNPIAEVPTKRAMDISCIVTFRAEDLIAHRTLRGISRAVDFCKRQSLNVETVCVLDDATSLTRELVAKSAPDIVIETSFGDSALARNAGVQRSSGKYVAFVEGDDFVSANWLHNAYRQMEATSSEVALHPEMGLAFGKSCRHWYHPNQDSPEFHVGNLLCLNYWGPAVFVRRETCTRIPFVPARAQDGFGYEDWHWNTLLAADGVQHAVVPLTACFVRVKTAGSRFPEPNAAGGVILPSPLFSKLDVFDPRHEARAALARSSQAGEAGAQTAADGSDAQPEDYTSARTKSRLRALADNMKLAAHSWRMALDFTLVRPLALLRPPRPVLGPLADNMKRAAHSWGMALYFTLLRPLVLLLPSRLERWCWRVIHRVKPLLLEPFKAKPRAPRPVPPAHPLPGWLVEELRSLSEIEPGLFPDREFLDHVPHHRTAVPLRDEVPVYAATMKILGSGHYSHVFLVQSLKPGGSELEALYFIRALVNEFHKTVLVIITDDGDSPWLRKLPDTVTALEFGKAAKNLEFDEQRLVLLRLLLQLRPAVIHNLCSYLGWSLYAVHGRCFSGASRLFASLFCDDYSVESKRVGFADPFFYDAYSHMTCVFADSRKYPRTLCDTYGYSEKRFRTIYIPAPEMQPRRSMSLGSTRKILWAGRLTRQKRPDILCAIARALPQLEFHVYGSSVWDVDKHYPGELRKVPNIILHGVYDGFSSLPLQDFALFLYTSQWDGLPNVLLEAAACGLPIVASSVGGVPEVIHQETGYPVEPYDDIPRYVAAILQVLSRPEEAAGKADRAMRLVSERHSWEHFVRSVAALDSYLGDANPPR